MSEHHHQKLAALHSVLLHGKLPRNLHWTEVLALIESIGKVEHPAGDEYAFVVGAQRELFKRHHGSELGVEEASRLRRFLKAATVETAPVDSVPAGRMVVVIDHHAAHVFRDLSGTLPQDGSTIKPYDPHHFHHHLVHRKEAHYRGDRVPEEISFYAEVTQALVPAAQIVLIGHGTGKSSAVDALVEYMKTHRSDVYRHVVSTEIADLSAITAPEVEAIARRHMMSAGPAVAV